MRNLSVRRQEGKGIEKERGEGETEGGEVKERGKGEEGRREMVKREKNAPSPPGYACSSRTGHTNYAFFSFFVVENLRNGIFCFP